MIVYTKLLNMLRRKGLAVVDLRKAGLAANTPFKFPKNKPISTETINRICEYFKVQPGDIMEWIPDAEYEKANAEKLAIEAQIAELQAKLKTM